MTDERDKAQPPQPTRVQKRLVRSARQIETEPAEEILYQHSAICQISMPYRNPGPDVREWEREQGGVAVRIEAGAARDEATGKWIKFDLPSGPKPRLILAHLNREALLTRSAVIEVDKSMTRFITRILGYDPGGHEVHAFKLQLANLCTALFRIAMPKNERPHQENLPVVGGFDLFFRKDEHSRVPWPQTVRLSEDYYQDLRKHAVPLDERALRALGHSTLELDLYCWAAQRLHRIDERRPALITWPALKAQFGVGFKRMSKFKEKFHPALKAVTSQYPGARMRLDRRGLKLRHSAPPVLCRHSVVRT